MRTNPVSFVLNSKNRRRIVLDLLAGKKRQWSCAFLEQETKIAHATVFRTLQELTQWGILRSIKINRRDVIYELAPHSPWVSELERAINLETDTARKIGLRVVDRTKEKIQAALLYGSSIKGQIKPDSDVDILVIISHHNKEKEQEINDVAAKVSLDLNRTVSLVIMDKLEIRKEINNSFLQSVRNNHEVLYGKTPFAAGEALV